MSVYLGNSGGVEIRRTGEPYGCILRASDVNVNERRFSIDFDPDFPEERPSPLITGDEVQFTSQNGTTDLELVSGFADPSITRWVHVDQVGGIRLYTSYSLAVTGGKDTAVQLVQPTADQSIVIDVANIDYNCVAQIREWEITTQRETVDTSILGEEYREFYDQGMISGQGTISAIWDYRFTPCVDSFSERSELANYFSQLVIRFREGSKFKAVFTVFFGELGKHDSVWYECDCICTNVGMTFAPGSVIDSTIQFITTGQIWLKQGDLPSFLLLENNGEILLETPPGAIELEFDE